MKHIDITEVTPTWDNHGDWTPEYGTYQVVLGLQLFQEILMEYWSFRKKMTWEITLIMPIFGTEKCKEISLFQNEHILCVF